MNKGELINDGIHEELDELSAILAKEMNLSGSVNIQLRENEGQFYIFEVNARFSSTVHIRSKLGFKDVLWSISGDDGSYQNLKLTDKDARFGVFNTSVELP